MKWKPNHNPQHIGDRRARDRFAWWPVTLDDGWCIWLEPYRTVETYDWIDGIDDNAVLRWQTIERFQLT